MFKSYIFMGGKKKIYNCQDILYVLLHSKLAFNQSKIVKKYIITLDWAG